MHPSTGVLVAAALVVALVVGPWLARLSVRLIAPDGAGGPTATRVGVTTALLAGMLTGVALLPGPRPAQLAFGWAAAAGVVLGAVDLATHRLPDRVTFPAYGGCAAALLADATAVGSWSALLRAVLAAAAVFAVAVLAAAVSPEGLGFGDVKLLGLLGLLLGWLGWAVLLVGLFLGVLAGAVLSLGLVATRRAGWRSAVPFGPPLLVGAALAVALAALS